MQPADNPPAHAICGAKTRSGNPCRQAPMHGQKRCRMHGGSTPKNVRAAERRMAEQDAAVAVARFGGRVDVSPAEALLDLVHHKAAEVAYWRARVAALPDDQLAGLLVTGSEKGRGPQGPVDTVRREAAGHIDLTLLHKAEDQLAAYSAAAIRAGATQALVDLYTRQGATLLAVLDAAIAATLAAVGGTLGEAAVQQIITAAIDQEAA